MIAPRGLGTVLMLSVLPAALLATACKRADAAGLDPAHHLAQLSFPLFSETYLDVVDELVQERQEAGCPETSLTDQIDWAEDFDEAFARATAEDKPVLLALLVRENGDTECDV